MLTSSVPMPAWNGLPVDASGLYRHPVFRCTSLARSQTYLNSALSEHRLRPAAGEVDSALYLAQTGRVKMMVLRYGPEIEITPRPFQGFSLVQIPLHGSTQIECDGQRVQVAPGESALIAPRRHVRLLWSRGCEQLIVRVPHDLLQTAVQTREVWRRSAYCKGELLAPITLITGVAGMRWNAFIQSLIGLAPQAQDETAQCHPAWTEHSELGVAVFLLTLQREFAETHVVAEHSLLGQQSRRVAARCGDPLAAAEQYVRAHLSAPVGLVDLARAAGVSARTLHVYCVRRHGVGPMRWLRNLRLDVAHARLQQDRGVRVTEVAMACGFGHLGRFAAYYRERFGELPHRRELASASA